MKSYDYQNRSGVNRMSWETFQQLCMLLADNIAAENISLVLGIARGGLYPATLISSMLQKEFYPLRVTRREYDRVSVEHPVWRVDVTDEVNGKTVLIVDDIADTGESLEMVAKRAKEKGAASAITAAVVTHSWSNPKPDYFGLESDELIIFPWDTQIRVNGAWQLHPELQEALKKQA